MTQDFNDPKTANYIMLSERIEQLAQDLAFTEQEGTDHPMYKDYQSIQEEFSILLAERAKLKKEGN